MKTAILALKRGQQTVLVATLAVATILPLIDLIGGPLFGFRLSSTHLYVQHATLWLAFVGAIAATAEGSHLTLSTTEFLHEGRARMLSRLFGFSVAAAVSGVLAYASYAFVVANRNDRILPGLGVPEWVSSLVMPVALGVMALVFAWKASDRWWGRLVGLLVIPAAFAVGLVPVESAGRLWPLGLLVLGGAFLGAPVFVAMGGIALVGFVSEGTTVAAVSSQVYRLLASETLPAIPLLTAAGYVLAESAAADRLVRFFRALFGWMPGGVAVMVAAVCAMFTTFTGGSGVTIIALGGLVYPILRRDGYSEGFSLGLVTAAGSLGLLFPPSLPVLLYSIVASTGDQSVPVDNLYIAGFLPGMLLVVITAIYGMVIGRQAGRERQRFTLGEVARATWHAKWELLLPVMIVALFLSGFATMLQTAAAALAYTVVVECFITRDLGIFRSLPAALLKAAALMGAVLILLSIAMGLTIYLVDVQLPDMLLAWVQAHIHSEVVFLLALNVLLLVLGSVVEIYSAIIILAPLIAPLAAVFNINPIHLGVIFLANLELGFLFPPVGLNLFLSSSRFNKPLPQLYRHVVPFLIILGIGVLLITYVPAMSVGVLRLLGR
ncbi:MAG TPA: TRAP transporter large permease subunit [Vicinamibacterales bacterium]|jgi:tripartite ATP-independent transporter DctM subunit